MAAYFSLLPVSKAPCWRMGGKGEYPTETLPHSSERSSIFFTNKGGKEAEVEAGTTCYQIREVGPLRLLREGEKNRPIIRAHIRVTVRFSPPLSRKTPPLIPPTGKIGREKDGGSSPYPTFITYLGREKGSQSSPLLPGAPAVGRPPKRENKPLPQKRPQGLHLHPLIIDGRGNLPIKHMRVDRATRKIDASRFLNLTRRYHSQGRRAGMVSGEAPEFHQARQSSSLTNLIRKRGDSFVHRGEGRHVCRETVLPERRGGGGGGDHY